jgi:LysR family glycine cleavage system transcriptional activator
VRSSRRLPPLSELIAFECAARHCNFTRAGAELGISRAAVSRHIRELEALLGVALFERRDNAVQLTWAGREIYGGVSRGLEEVSASLEAVVRRPAFETVRVCMTSAAYSFWLAPALDAFRIEYPIVRLRLSIVEQHQQFELSDTDVAVRFGSDAPVGFSSVLLTEEEIEPVCAPAYLAGRELIDAVELPREALLDLEHPYRPVTTWQHWFDAIRIASPGLRPRITFDLYSAYVYATLRGQGIALLGPPIIAESLRMGSLVRASRCKPIRSGAFYAHWRKGRSKAIDALVDWLTGSVGR